MGAFRVKSDRDKIASVNRTIRMKQEVFTEMTNIARSNGISFNKLVNQCLEFALDNLEEDS